MRNCVTGRRHRFFLGSVGCPVGEGHGVFGGRGNPAVRHGPASDVAGQIDEHAFAVVIAVLDVDIPFLPAELVLEVLPLLECHGGRKGESCRVSMASFIVGKELSPEYRHDRPDGEKVALVACLVSIVRSSKASFGDQAVEVGMEDHGLAPGMESGDDAGLCAEVLGI